MTEDNGNILTEVAPGAIERIHLVGVAGTGMGAFAGMLKAEGYTVTGSDENVYPPMSDMLAAWEIEVFSPYSAENIDRAKPDLVIIGNVIRRTNPEATVVRELATAIGARVLRSGSTTLIVPLSSHQREK